MEATPAELPASTAPAWSRSQVEDVFRIHEGFLRRLAARLCRDTFDPEDLVQDMLERSIAHADAWTADIDHRAWMARVLRNLFIDRLRRRTTAPEHAELADEPPAPIPESRPWWHGLGADDIRALLGELSDDLRGAFELFAFQGCSYAEVATRLGIPKMTAGTRILRARRRLKQLLLERHGHGGSDD
ncbi:MAG TPA: RNA polymerase sigma factor [Kofleriaceae bacterium]|jgi:RNA polymerase sigma-70 factor (ECF subfamily)